MLYNSIEKSKKPFILLEILAMKQYKLFEKILEKYNFELFGQDERLITLNFLSDFFILMHHWKGKCVYFHYPLKI